MSWRFRRATLFRRHSAMLQTSTRQPQSPFDLRAENAVSRQRQQQRFVFNALWELPIGDEEEKTGKSEENTGWLTQAFSHIEVATDSDAREWKARERVDGR